VCSPSSDEAANHLAHDMAMTTPEANDRYKNFDSAETSFVMGNDDPPTPHCATSVPPLRQLLNTDSDTLDLDPVNSADQPRLLHELSSRSESIAKVATSLSMGRSETDVKKLIRRLVFELDESVRNINNLTVILYGSIAWWCSILPCYLEWCCRLSCFHY
jgi:hypothetical protein